MSTFLPVAQPDLNGHEKHYVCEAIEEGWISSTGRFLDRFEREFADFCGTRHAIACCNGTAAIHLVLLGMGIGTGDEVIVPSFTYVAAANAITYTGARPIFVDSELIRWNVDANRLEAAITPRTRAILAVHLYGNPADMNAIDSIAKRHDLAVIEDAAEAHGAQVEGRKVGSLGLAGTFSFYGNKILTTGEGGIVTTDDDSLAARVRQLRGQGMDPQRRYWFPMVGHNYRMTNIAAAIGCAQLERAEELLGHRLRIARGYRERLAPWSDRLGVVLPVEVAWAKSVHWLSSVRVPVRQRDSLMAFLLESGIETRPFFTPMHRLPIYADASFRQGRELPIAEELGESGMNLPTWSNLMDADLDRICDAVVKGLTSA